MRQFLTIFFLVSCWAVSPAQQSKTEYLQSERGDALHWTGLKWTPEEAALFGGMPRQVEVRQHLLVLRYSFYVSHYDAEKRVPLWVSHVVRADSADKARGRTKGAWSRNDDKFTPELEIVNSIYTSTEEPRGMTTTNDVGCFRASLRRRQ